LQQHAASAGAERQQTRKAGHKKNAFTARHTR
jgi:hypothetical protein